MRKAAHLTAALCLFLTSGCSPVQQFFFKEKQINHNAPPSPAIHVDPFIYQQARGRVDILLVVDNTDTYEPMIPYFEESYRKLVAAFSSGAARMLDFRIQVVTTPIGRSPKNWFAPERPADPQIEELFIGTSETPKIFDHQERPGYLSPMTSTLAGLSSPALGGRDHVPLFILYFLGGDMGAGETGMGNSADFKAALDQGRGMYQVSSWFFTRSGTPVSSEPAFPFCENFQPAYEAQRVFGPVPWRSSRRLDLCDSKWPEYSTELLSSVIDFKKKMILSLSPYSPETMVLRSSTHMYRYGDEYVFDSATNEITFTRPGNLVEGDLLEVSYYLKPEKEILSGHPNPGPLPPLPAAK